MTQATSEETVRRRNDELEQLLAERTRQLNTAVADLESFSRSISHELRAPLRAIDNFSRILLEEHAADLGPEGQRLFRVVCKNTAAMGKLIDGLLAVAEAARRKLIVVDVDIQSVTREALAQLAPAMSEPATGGRRFRVAVNAPVHVMADRLALREVLARLLSNAIKFTRSREVAEIEVTATSTGREIVCSVRDNGVGFEPEYAHKLFNLFQRLHAADEFEGVGIGLAIVKRLIESQGGRVWAQGAPEKGATVSFALPNRGPGVPEDYAK